MWGGRGVLEVVSTPWPAQAMGAQVASGYTAGDTILVISPVSLSSYPTFLCVAAGWVVVDKNIHTIGAKQGQCHEIFDFWFFHESVSPKLLSIPLRPFRKFAEIFAAQGAQPVLLTPVANEKNRHSKKFVLFCLDTFGSRVKLYVDTSLPSSSL